jgi:ligand-binding SRPBCC domain-containing protein
MPIVTMSTTLYAPPETCFDAARDLDLHLKSLAHTGERAVAGRTSGLIEGGEQVTWEGRHFGVRQRFTSQITAFDRPRYFQDTMVRGAFASYVHDHFFDVVDGGTVMRDVLEFRSPLGALGRTVDRVIMVRYLKRLLEGRNEMIKRCVERIGYHSPYQV